MGTKDHPRVCGEQVTTWAHICLHTGSPPRVRGTGSPPCTAQKSSRITPACAGNSYADALFAVGLRDHPRVCGEQVQVSSGTAGMKGSPPRVRGTAFMQNANQLGKGITPACAGNSAS